MEVGEKNKAIELAFDDLRIEREGNVRRKNEVESFSSRVKQEEG